MTASGGIATLEGIRYEVKAVLYEVPGLLRGDVKTIRYQPQSSALDATDCVKEIGADDYSVLYSSGDACYCQAKQTTSFANWTMNRLHTEGVLEQFVRQSASTPEARLRFVSNVPAQQLDQLAAHAKRTVSLEEFGETWSDDVKTWFGFLETNFDSERVKLWEMLSNVEVCLLTKESIDNFIQMYVAEQYANGDEFIRVVKEVIERDAGRAINQEVMRKELEKEGLYQVSALEPDELGREFREASGQLRQHCGDIEGEHLERAETQKLREWIDLSSGEGQIAFLTDIAGAGKSVIMRDLLVCLEGQGMPVLAIKADSLGAIVSEQELQGCLNLSDMPEKVFSTLSRQGTCVLLVDQVDALSQTFSRNTACLDLMLRLITRIAGISGVRVVASCREFDYKFDPKLRQLKTTEFKIQPLSQAQIEQVLNRIGMKWNDLTGREQGLLENPQNLRTYAEVVVERKRRGERAGPFATLQDLYEELWKLKVLGCQAEDVHFEDVRKAIYCLVDGIHETQVLTQPAAGLDRWPRALQYLQSVCLLAVEGPNVRFFHQSFFDYCYARRFVEEKTSLAKYITGGDQGLFVRSQMVQTLTYMRGTQLPRYARELAQLINSELRYHLKELLFAWFGQLSDITELEQTVGLQCLGPEPKRRLLLVGANGNPEWFDILSTHFSKMFELQDEEVDMVVSFLISVEEERGDGVFELLKPKLGTSERWDNRIIRCVCLYKKWECETAKSILLDLCRRCGDSWLQLPLAMHNVSEGDIEFACEALQILLARALEKWLMVESPDRFAGDESCAKAEDANDTGGYDSAEYAAFVKEKMAFDKYANLLLPSDAFWMQELTEKACNECPNVFVESVLPWVEECLPKLVNRRHDEGLLSDAIFSRAFSDVSRDEPATYLIEGLKKALENIANTDQVVFEQYAARMSQTQYLVLHQVIIRVLIKHAAKYAEWGYQYLIAEEGRMDVPEVLGGNISRKLVAAIFRHLDKSRRCELEKVILAYCPDWEKRVDCLKYRGLGQHELLFDIPEALLSKKGVRRKGELGRKFAGRTPFEPGRPECTAVGSPIPMDKCKNLSEENWLQVMRGFDDSTGWGEKRERFLRGGIVELSRTFQGLVKEDPGGYTELFERFDESISSVYFAAFLRGFEESNAESDTLFGACQKAVVARGNDLEIQKAVCDVLEKKAKAGVPSELIDYVRETALSATDPDHDVWKDEAQSGGKYYGGNPLDHGINTVRGRGVLSYVNCVLHAESYGLDKLFSTLERIANDTVLAVRACMIRMLPYILHLDRDRVVLVFEKSLKGAQELLDYRVSHQFIYYTIRSDANEALKYIAVMTESTDKEVCEAAGRLGTLVSFETEEGVGFVNDKMKSSTGFLKGMASVYSRNVDNPELVERCLDGLLALCEGSVNDIIGEIGKVFRYLPPLDNNIVAFIDVFVGTEISGWAAKELVEYLLKNYYTHGDYALETAEKVAKVVWDSGSNERGVWQIDDDLIKLIVGIYNHLSYEHLRSRAMDLFDTVLEKGSHHAREVLRTVDR